MTTTADIRALLDKLESAASKEDVSDKILAEFTGSLATIAVTLGDMAAALDKPEKPEAPEKSDPELISAIKGLKLSPVVNVAAAKVPEVNVTVQPAQVVVMPANSEPVKGWKFIITQRDGNGAIRSISMQPE